MTERLRRITNHEARITHERADTRDGVRSCHRSRDSCAALTASKMFCACPVTFGAPPNTLICPVCLGLPGSLPVLNRKAVDLGLRTAAALGCTMHPTSQFHRKNYSYPDLPKNYQITQYRYKVHPPLTTDGSLELPGRR